MKPAITLDVAKEMADRRVQQRLEQDPTLNTKVVRLEVRKDILRRYKVVNSIGGVVVV